MSFIETPRFPDYISFEASGGPEYQTEVVVLASGAEQRNINWDQPRARYQFAMPLTSARKDELLAWHRAMKGRAHGFRFKDWADYSVAQSAGGLSQIVAGVADLTPSANGTGMPTYQLMAAYTTGALIEYRKIRKPVSGTATIYRGGSAATAGASAGNYALDTTTGVVTWVASASNNVTAVTVGATTAVTLAGTIGLAIGGKLYLTGVSGTVGNALNGVAHTITNIVGNVHTISTATTGLTWGGAGIGLRYPQPTETLQWAGEFDVPVRFDSDQIGVAAAAPSLYRIDNLALIEIRT